MLSFRPMWDPGFDIGERGAHLIALQISLGVGVSTYNSS